MNNGSSGRVCSLCRQWVSDEGNERFCRGGVGWGGDRVTGGDDYFCRCNSALTSMSLYRYAVVRLKRLIVESTGYSW